MAGRREIRGFLITPTQDLEDLAEMDTAAAFT
jgi:hypothetical protein